MQYFTDVQSSIIGGWSIAAITQHELFSSSRRINNTISSSLSHELATILGRAGRHLEYSKGYVRPSCPHVMVSASRRLFCQYSHSFKSYASWNQPCQPLTVWWNGNMVAVVEALLMDNLMKTSPGRKIMIGMTFWTLHGGNVAYNLTSPLDNSYLYSFFAYCSVALITGSNCSIAILLTLIPQHRLF